MPNQKLPIQPVLWSPKQGGLNKDTDLQDMPVGDLPDALNVRSSGEGNFVSPDYEPILGNGLKQYNPDVVVAQNKIFLITVDTGTVAIGYTVDVTVFDQNQNPVGTPSTIMSFNGNDFAYAFSQLETTLDFLLGTGNYSITGNPTSVSQGTIIIEIINNPNGDPIPYANWNIVFDNYANPVVTSFDVTVTQEAIDGGLAGEMHNIGSFDLNGDVFQFWTSQNKDPLSMTIISVADNGSGLIRIEVADTSNIIQNSLVYITGTGGTTPDNADGKFIVDVIDATHFDLMGSSYTAPYTTGGTALFNNNGNGEIGVAVEDINTATAISINYTRLIRSTEFNFRTYKQIQCDGRKQGDKVSLYYTDWYNVPRVFYYIGTYITDGAITAINPLGEYAYGSIASESRLILTFFNSHLIATSQTQSGGNLTAGNYRYAYRFLSENFSATEWSDLINPVNVYAASSTGDPLVLKGDIEGADTGKINVMQLINIPTGGIFKFVELAVIQYIGNAYSGLIVRRDELTGNSTQQIIHSGFETDSTILDIGTLNTRYSNILTARNVALLNSRNYLSNLTYAQVRDFRAFAETGRHSIERVAIESVGEETASPPTYRFGEYFDSQNVFNFVGYCLNDTYRFGIKFKLKPEYGGGFTPVYWYDDIRIDLEATNVTTPNRRDASTTATDYDITTQYGVGVDPAPYVWYVDLYGLDLTYLIDGVQVKDLIESIVIDRVERIPEILGNGYFVPAVSGELPLFPGQPMYYEPLDPTNTLGSFPFITGETFNSYNGLVLPDNVDYPTATTGPGAFTAERNYGEFYWMDNIYNLSTISFLANDTILTYGSPEKSPFYPTGDVGKPTEFQNQYCHYNGATGQTVKPTENVVINAINMTLYQAATTINGALKFSKQFRYDGIHRWGNMNSLAMHLTNSVTDINTYGNDDFGFYIAQYYRALSDYSNYLPDESKYGQRNSSKYIPTGAYLDIDASTPNIITSGSLKVFGGDVFCQMNFFKFRYPAEDSAHVTADMGFGGGVGFYSANTMNWQMRRKKDDTISEIYPKYPLVDWLQEEDSNVQGLDPALYYNNGYTIRNGVNSDAAYDPNLTYQTSAESLIIYSQLSSLDAQNDNLRVFLPLDQKSLDLVDGPITHHTVSNGRLLTIQPRRFMSQFINNTAVFSTTDGSEVITGDGGVLKQTGQTLSTYGSSNKWSCIKGKSKGGHDIDFWLNVENGIIMRLGYDGSNPISREHNMMSWFENNVKWVYGKDTPAHAEGVHGVWFDKFLEAIWTFRGKKVVVEWSDETLYTEGQTVNLSDSTIYNTFEHFDTIWRVKPGQVSTAAVRPDDDLAVWELVLVTDNNFYNFYSIVWSEFKNRFQCFVTFKPKIFNKMKNYFLSPRPIGNESWIYRHNTGTWCQWYDNNDGSIQAEDGYFDPVFKDPEEAFKHFLASRVDSDIVPYRINDITDDHFTYSLAADFETRNNLHDCPTFNDATLNNDPQGDGSDITGHFLRKRVIFQNGIYQKVKSIIQKLRVLARTNGM